MSPYGFPATCRPALQTSRAIAFLDVDCAEDGGVEQPLTLKKMRQLCAESGQTYMHFVQVEWRSGSQRYTYAATPEFARRLQGAILRVNEHESQARSEPWTGESLGTMIDVARKKKDLIADLNVSAMRTHFGSRSQVSMTSAAAVANTAAEAYASSSPLAQVHPQPQAGSVPV